MARLWTNSIRGVLSSGVTSSDTTLSASIFEELPEVSSPDTLLLTLDPNRDEGLGKPELVEVTAHSAGSTSVTVTRAVEQGDNGNTAQAWPSGTTVVHAGMASDMHAEPFENVTAHGATGDGSTDDTTAIQSAIDRANGMPVWFPPGTYRTTAALSMPSDTTLIGAGGSASVIKPEGSIYSLDAEDKVHIRIKSLWVDAVNQTGGGCVRFQGVRNSLIWGCRFSSAPTNTVLVREDATTDVISENVTIEGCEFNGEPDNHHCAIAGAAGLFSDNIRVVANRMGPAGECGINFSRTNRMLAYGNMITSWARRVDGNAAIRIANGGVDGVVADNVCGSSAAEGRGFHVANGNDVIFSSNSIYNVGQHGMLIASGNADIVVSGNVFRNCHGGANTDPAIRLDDAVDCTVTGNRVLDETGSNHTYGVGETGTSDYNAIVGNTLRDNPSGGVNLAGANSVSTGNTA